MKEKVFSPYPEIKLIYIGKLNINMIFLYDIVIIPFHLDQIFLYKIKPYLKKYLTKGGILILLGATEDPRHWFPLSGWEPKFTSSLNIDNRSPDGKIIFKDIPNANYMWYHSKYFAHGSLLAKVPIREYVKLAWDNEGRIVMYIRRTGINGTLFATTLDPDFHSSTTVPGPLEEQVEITHSKAEHLLHNIIEWAKVEAKSKKYSTRFKRMSYAMLKLIGSFSGIIILYLLPILSLGYFSYLILSKDKIDTIEKIAVSFSAIGVMGSIASLISLFQTLKAERFEK